MKLDFAIFTHSAILSPKGMFSLLEGGYEWISAKSFPATIQNLALLARISFEANECGKEYRCAAKAIGPGGIILSSDLFVIMRPTINPKLPDKGSTFTGHFGFNGFTFLKSGSYCFSLSVDDVPLGNATIEVFEDESQ
jgi:hypothetical protein